ncbi:YceI family protein [Gynurincola endophyticus]|uniref:YceI family protein n=1 Tax=Gynurincola endophyticus TaxID=2479004 RepID=UPI000F8C648B|nr:YceI family protein [Gynurincola endophyticus]
MKTFNVLVLAGAVLFATACGNSNEASVKDAQEVAEKAGFAYGVDLQNSIVNWKAFHKGGFAPRWGTLTIKDGEITVAEGNLTAGDFVIDMTTLTVDSASVSEAGKKHTDLQNHLKSADFFQVDSFPTAEFQVTSVTDLAPGAATNAIEGANKTVSGNLTLLGKTLNVTFPAKVAVDDTKVTVNALFTVNRTDWNLKFGTSEADPAEWMISKDIEVSFNVTALKK